MHQRDSGVLPVAAAGSGVADSEAWAEMVARMAAGNCRLHEVMARGSRRGTRGVLQQLELERSRIARDLHAGAGQPLAGIRMNLDILDSCAPSLPTEAREAMERLHNLAESALAEVRAVSHRLHPPDWQTFNTEQAVRHLLVEMGAAVCFAETSIDIRHLPVEPGHGARLALYRCAQECITNVIRHAQATRLTVSLIPKGEMVELTVGDNGKGLGVAPSSGGGLGLNAIREHVAASGGACNIKSGSGGTTIAVTIPLFED